jgi:hypothetical protein
MAVRRTHNNIFAPGGVDVRLKVLLSLFRSVLGKGRSFKLPPDRKYLRYAQAPRTRRILRPQNKIHPAPLLICFAAFQIGSPLRGDGDAVDNFFTAPRFTAPGQGRRRTRHVGRFFGP